MPKLLIIDDEAPVLYSLEKSLRSADLEIVVADTGRAGVERARDDRPDVVLCDVRLPDMTGLEVLDRIQTIDRRVPVIIMTAFATTDTAIEAMKRGAFEYLLKPLDLPRLRDAVARAAELSRLSRTPAVFDDSTAPLDGDLIVGRSAVMHEIYKSIGRAAPQDVAVLILGESGVGKELVARAIYQHSRRSRGPFLPINCAAIPEALLESELFGHERGAFTGAERRRIGKFEQASGGTIFLDEIGDMTPATQAKVLRLLQEQRFERVGGSETIQVDVRMIAATNQNLEELVAQGRFRQDLYYRLNGFCIHVPALRDRQGDVSLLLEHFRQRVNRELGRHVRGFAPDALRRLLEHPWPGNVRELQSTVKYAVVRSTGDVVTLDCLPESVRGRSDPNGGRAPLDAPTADLVGLIERLVRAREPEIHQTVHLEVDRLLLDAALRECKGSQVEAAELLGISRNTLRARLRALGMTVEKRLQSEG